LFGKTQDSAKRKLLVALPALLKLPKLCLERIRTMLNVSCS